jgi:uncharacterized tellurite resistance protein B-like protein
MADWKRLCRTLILKDGSIGDKETDIITKEFLSEGVINKSEAEFLIDLRNSASRAAQKFHEFVFDIVQKALLADGTISAAETAWLEKFLLADGKVDELEKAFLKRMKAAARETSPAFEALMKKYVP